MFWHTFGPIRRSCDLIGVPADREELDDSLTKIEVHKSAFLPVSGQLGSRRIQPGRWPAACT